MNAKKLRQTYLKFFESKDHKIIPSAPIVTENDPTTLFISAGMQPLVPFLLGQPHSQGRRLTSVQKCIRTDDIDEVGDVSHHTFFEMLGNWSLGDYFKKEAIEWSFEFLTQFLKIPAKKINVTIFEGDEDAPFDEESKQAWLSVGIPENRIFPLPKKYNWWGPAGKTGPCGPDSEMYIDTGNESCGPDCKPGTCDCGKYLEIWNDVFMEYNKTEDGRFEKLQQRNVDTGMGVDRTTSILEEVYDDYKTELFWPLIEKIQEISGKDYVNNQYQKSMRIIADHSRATAFLMADGVTPSNVERGYILRRLIRRALRYFRQLEVGNPGLWPIVSIVIEDYSDLYPELTKNKVSIKSELEKEEQRFLQALGRGLNAFKKLDIHTATGEILGEVAFDYFQTYGFPPEMFLEEVTGLKAKFDEADFWKTYQKAFDAHQELSRTATEGMFKSGLADHSYQVTRFHTATHLLQAALRQVLGDHVQQRGSNLTAERLRFDFSHGEKLTPEQIKRVEGLVNAQISKDQPVTVEIVSIDEARKRGAIMLFNEKYGDRVNLYKIDDFSLEACAGPHVENTSELGHFKIIKEESVSAGVRRIKAVLD